MIHAHNIVRTTANAVPLACPTIVPVRPVPLIAMAPLGAVGLRMFQ